VTARMSPFRLMLYTAAVLVVLAFAYLVLQVGSVLVIVILGIILSAAIEPIVYRLRRYGLGRGQAILSIYVVLLLIISAGIYLILPPVIRQGADLVENIPAILSNLREQTEASQNQFIRETGTSVVGRAQRVYQDFRDQPPIEGGTALQLVTSTFGVLFTFITTLIVAFYWMTEKAIIKRLLLGLLPPRNRDRVHGIWDNVEAKLGGWTRGQLVLCLAIGLASAVAYSPLALDLPFWLALALWAGITELIPFIGPFLGGGVAAVVAVTQSVETAVLVVVFVVILQQVEGAWLVPRVMRNAVGLTPLTVVIAVQVGAALGGPIAAILAIPIAGAVQVVIQELLAGRREGIDFGLARPRPNLRLLTEQRSPNDAALDPDGLPSASAAIARGEGRPRPTRARPARRPQAGPAPVMAGSPAAAEDVATGPPVGSDDSRPTAVRPARPRGEDAPAGGPVLGRPQGNPAR
jgi:predicted PurR-regulated permease PerM